MVFGILALEQLYSVIVIVIALVEKLTALCVVCFYADMGMLLW